MSDKVKTMRAGALAGKLTDMDKCRHIIIEVDGKLYSAAEVFVSTFMSEQPDKKWAMSEAVVIKPTEVVDDGNIDCFVKSSDYRVVKSGIEPDGS